MIPNAFIASNGLIVNGNAEINGDLTVSGFAYASSSYAITASYALNFSGTSGINGTDGTSGTSGQNGTSGTSGNSGTDGTSGSSGESGTSGTNGLSGTSGTSGESGTSGTTGTSGTSGATGSSGQSGSDGTSGTSGTSGVSGATGSSGTSGTDGTSGSSGSTGISGTSGTSGSTGSSGQSGSDGTSGTSGTSGVSGATGSSGTSGTNGASGTSGINGTSGFSGTSGTSGETGTSGTSGATGSSGTSGTDGTSGATGASGTSGSSGTSGATGASGTSGSSGTSGATGASGTSGSSGTSGATGASGTSGSSGASGTSGSSGASGTSGSSGTSGTSGSSGTSGAGTISGGIANYVARFTGATTLTTGSIFDNATNVGIGKATPNAKLDVYGDTIITGSLSVTGNITNIDNVSANSITVAGQPTTYGTVNPAYIMVGLVTGVTGFGVGSTVIFDTLIGNVNSQVSYNSSSGVFTLSANVTYDMSFTPSFISFTNTTGGYACYEWVDATTNTTLDSTGTGIGTGVPNTENSAQQDNLTARIIYKPSTNQTVKLRVTSGNGTVTLRGSIGTQAIIRPLNLSIAVQATATGTLNTDYIQVEKTTNQTLVGNSTDITFNATTATNGGITQSAGVFTLTAGKTYLLEASLCVSQFTSNSAYIWYSWVDATTNAQLDQSNGGGGAVGSSGVAIPVTWTGIDNYTSTAKIIYTPVTTQTVKLRITDATGTCSVLAIGTKATITQIANTFSLNALDTMTLTGALTATGSITSVGNVSGNTFYSTNSVGDEGGEIDLAKCPNSTLTGSNVVIDQYVDRIRFFESGGSSRGVYIDLTQAAAGVGTLLNNRVSGLVNAGVDVTLGNLKVRMSTSGNRSLQVSTVSGTYSVYGSSVYSTGGPGGTSITDNAPLTITTTPTYINAGYSFGLGGYTDTWLLMSTASNIAWRITLIVGSSYNNNMISIERLL